ncbi:MAG: RNA polymerase sigma-70 factor [Saprospiraceae bacterium]|nr:RNA polymerase sigma-70 factor [Saprospiraceae bacterium]MDZ4704179.1 RNA polymerase sigma-70 factor [Saprospiraceae bacterium]
MQENQHIPDDLLRRFKQGDSTALKVLFQQHYGLVCRTISRFISDHVLVEDLSQEVFVRFWEKRGQIEITTSVPAYLRRMAINEGLAWLRRNQRFDQVELTPQTPSAGFSADGEALFLHNELNLSIHQAIDGLPPKCRAVFQLSRFEELTYPEIARQMGISVKTVENQMGKALKILRERLKGYLQV